MRITFTTSTTLDMTDAELVERFKDEVKYLYSMDDVEDLVTRWAKALSDAKD